MSQSVPSHSSEAPGTALNAVRAGILPRTGQAGVWLGPAWAALCGAWVAGGFGWELSQWLRLVLLVVLVEGGWATLWAAACDEVWVAALEAWRAEHVAVWPLSLPHLPYTLPGAPGGRLAQWWADARAWWHAVLWPRHQGALGSLALGAAIALCAGLALGPRVFLLSVSVVALIQLAFLFSAGDGVASRGMQGIVLLGMPWLAGWLAFGGGARTGTVTLTVILLALAFAGAYTGLLAFLHEPPDLEDYLPWGGVAGALLVLGVMTTAVLFIATVQRLAGFVLGGALFPLLVWLPWYGPGLRGPALARLAQWPLAVVLAVCAVALALG